MTDADLIVSVDELDSYLVACGTAVTGASAVAQEILFEVQSALEAHLGRPVTVRTFTEDVRADGTVRWSDELGERIGGGNLYFRHSPVVAISSIEADGVAQDLTDERVRAWGLKDYRGVLGTSTGAVTVTYTAGVDGTDPEHAVLKRVVKEAAARILVRRSDGVIGSETLSDEGYSTAYVEPGAIFTGGELVAVSRYRRIKMGTW